VQALFRQKLENDKVFLKAVKIGLAAKMGISADQAEARIEKVLISFSTPKTIDEVVGELSINLKALPPGKTRKQLEQDKEFRKAVKAGLAKKLKLSADDAEKRLKVFLGVTQDELSLVQRSGGAPAPPPPIVVKVGWKLFLEDLSAICELEPVQGCPSTAVTPKSVEQVLAEQAELGAVFKGPFSEMSYQVDTGPLKFSKIERKTIDFEKSSYKDFVEGRIKAQNGEGNGLGSGTPSFLEMASTATGGNLKFTTTLTIKEDEDQNVLDNINLFVKKEGLTQEDEEAQSAKRKKAEEIAANQIEESMKADGVKDGDNFLTDAKVNKSPDMVVTETETEGNGDGDGSGNGGVNRAFAVSQITTFKSTGGLTALTAFVSGKIDVTDRTPPKATKQMTQAESVKEDEDITAAVQVVLSAGESTRNIRAQKTTSTLSEVKTGPRDKSSFGGGVGSGR